LAALEKEDQTMRTMKNTLIITASLLLAGCNLEQARVHTIHPFYTDRTTIFDPAILGTWIVEHDDFEMDFLSNKDESYLLTWNVGKDTIAFDAHLVQLGQHRYLDLHPNPDALDAVLAHDSAGLDLTQLVYVSRMLPLHWIYRLEMTDTCFNMEVICGDNLLSLIKKKQLRTRYVEYGNTVVLAAGTRRLQKIITRKKVDKLFTTAGGFSLQRPTVLMDSSHVHIAEAAIP
jgi:hypothetical protein